MPDNPFDRARQLRDERREQRDTAAPQSGLHYGDPRDLPPHMRRLHNRQREADRLRREALLEGKTDEERRWPGLVNENL